MQIDPDDTADPAYVRSQGPPRVVGREHPEHEPGATRSGGPAPSSHQRTGDETGRTAGDPAGLGGCQRARRAHEAIASSCPFGNLMSPAIVPLAAEASMPPVSRSWPATAASVTTSAVSRISRTTSSERYWFCAHGQRGQELTGFVDQVAARFGVGQLGRVCLDLAQRPGKQLVEPVHRRNVPPARSALPELLTGWPFGVLAVWVSRTGSRRLISGFRPRPRTR